MAETTKLVVEGDVTLAYFADQRNGKRVLIAPEISNDGPVGCGCDQECLESRISNEIDFPNDAEFDELYQKMEELRAKGLRTSEDEPDITRPARLRITVEVL